MSYFRPYMIGILLAAGRGTRMKSDAPKVLFDVNGQPLCTAPFEVLFELCEKVVVIIGYKALDVKNSITLRAEEIFGAEKVKTKVVFMTQDPPRGTGDAVRIAVEGLGKNLNPQDEIVVLNGDLPLIRKSTLEKFIKNSREAKANSSCLTMLQKNPKGLGRILRDSRGIFTGIREEKDASIEEKRILEINGGVYYFKADHLQAEIQKIGTNNSQQEFYLTDALGNHSHSRQNISMALPTRTRWDLFGVNNTYELAFARKISQMRLQKKLAENLGVEFSDPETVWISARTEIQGPCKIGPNTMIEGKSKISTGVFIQGNCHISDSHIDQSAQILWGSVIEQSQIGPKTSIGPMARIRPGCILKENVKVGNFVELKKTTMEKGSKASHLSYLGDASVGEETNIGCGTITCNYDGVNKYPTQIGAHSFIGSDTQLIAPVNIGDHAYVASGTTVTENIPAGALALSRAELVIKPGYAQKLADKFAEKKSKTKEH